MKIDKRNPMHWIYLLLLGGNVLVAILMRLLLHRQRTGRVLLYGHKRSGNLLAIHDWVLANHPAGLDVRFLTMDPRYYAELRRQGVPCVLAISPTAIGWLSTADAIVADHGLHALSLMLGMSDMKFFDVWHGIPFKGFDADDFRLQHRYDEVWVASNLCRKLYVDRFGFAENRVHVTGYARTDRLVRQTGRNQSLLQSLGVPGDLKRILFAPTWAQDDRGRSVFPFGCSQQAFFDRLAAVARKHRVVILWRNHLNTGGSLGQAHAEVIPVPVAQYPDSEAILQAADILICDWSSIAFDFLLLGRPVVFLDVPAPFRKGFSLGPEYRYGEIAAGLDDLMDRLEECLRTPEAYWERHSAAHEKVRGEIYGEHADGASAARCVGRLQSVIGKRWT